jgi:hypothetical protein
MKIREISKSLAETFLRGIAPHGFVELENKCIYVRRFNSVLHVATLDTSRHGPRFRVFLYPWVAEFADPSLKPKSMSELLLRHWVQETGLGPYTIGTAKWWPCDQADIAIASGEQMVAPFIRGALPYFDAIRSRRDVLPLLISSAPPRVIEELETENQLLPPIFSKVPEWSPLPGAAPP